MLAAIGTEDTVISSTVSYRPALALRTVPDLRFSSEPE